MGTDFIVTHKQGFISGGWPPVKHLYTFYMFYTAKGASGARLGARPNRRLRHPASRNAPGRFAKVSQTRPLATASRLGLRPRAT